MKLQKILAQSNKVCILNERTVERIMHKNMTKLNRKFEEKYFQLYSRSVLSNRYQVRFIKYNLIANLK